MVGGNFFMIKKMRSRALYVIYLWGLVSGMLLAFR